jgi:L-fucose isomerase-like protein
VTGSGHSTLHANVPHLLSAGRDVIVLIGGFAAIAAAISLTQASRKPQLYANDGNARQADASRFVHIGNGASCTQRRSQ